MKKIIYVFTAAIFIFGATAVLAANTSSGQGQGSGQQGASVSATPQVQAQSQVQTQQQTKNQGETTAIQNQQQTQLELMTAVKAKTVSELKEAISQKREELQQELQGLGEKEQKVYQNQNQVREAVHALLAAEDLTDGIGKQVSVIAQEFNNSVQKTIKAENKIQERGWLKRLWDGGDKEAADEISNEVKLNAGKVQQLLDLQKNCTKCSAEIKAVIEEQIQKVTAEQTRLENLSKEEKKAAGVWGWFKGLFSKNTTE
ncbi:MAG TPA: hypothetical protein P5089_01080 [Candidatus Portnoybacteria bacterium]|nr:hypothetical protein [Candidatus Portnoybacteria bacterium]